MYVKRDSQGRVSAVSVYAAEGFDEQLDSHDSELREFMLSHSETDAVPPADKKEKSLQASDAELARVLEDIIELLIAKGVIQFTELPQAAQEKLLARRDLRQRIRKLDLIGDDEENMLP